jgi:hypothetical protein
MDLGSSAVCWLPVHEMGPRMPAPSIVSDQLMFGLWRGATRETPEAASRSPANR